MNDVVATLPEGQKTQRQTSQHQANSTANILFGCAICAVASTLRVVGFPLELTSVGLAAGLLLLTFSLISMLYIGDWNPLRVIPVATILWYGTPMTYVDYVDPAVLSRISVPTAWITFLSISLYCTLPLILSQFIQMPFVRPFGGTQAHLKKYRRWLFIAAACQLLLIGSGTWTYGAQLLYYQRSEPSLLIIVCGFLFRPIILVVAIIAGRDAYLNKLTLGRMLYYGALYGTQVAWLTIDSRRNLAIGIVLSALMFLRTRFQSRAIPFKRLAAFSIACTLLVFTISFGWQIFYLMRQQQYMFGDRPNQDIFSVLANFDYINKDAAMASYNENVLRRPFLLTESVAIADSARKGSLLGEGLRNAAIWSIPAAIWGDKTPYPIGEPLWAERLSVPLNDWSNTLVLEGNLDFPWVGFSIYLITIFAMFRIAFWLISNKRNGIAYIFIASSAIFTCLSIEQSMLDYLVWFRNSLIFAVIAAAFSVMAPNHNRQISLAKD